MLQKWAPLQVFFNDITYLLSISRLRKLIIFWKNSRQYFLLGPVTGNVWKKSNFSEISFALNISGTSTVFPPWQSWWSLVRSWKFKCYCPRIRSEWKDRDNFIRLHFFYKQLVSRPSPQGCLYFQDFQSSKQGFWALNNSCIVLSCLLRLALINC